MKYTLCYDIQNNRRRRYVTKIMESYGYRVQKSVFEAFLSASDLAEVCNRLKAVISEKDDTVRLYRLCESCDRAVILFGNSERIEMKPYIVL